MQHQVSETVQRAVTVWREGQTLCVEPAPAQLLDALQTRRLMAVPDDRHGCRVRPERELMYEVWGGTRADCSLLKVWAGLEPVVRILLAKAGYAVTTLQAGPSAAQLPGPHIALVKKAGGADGRLLSFVRTKPHGLIRLGRQVGSPVPVVKQLALAWPGRNVTVAVTEIAEAYDMRDALRRHCPGVECYHERHHPAAAARVAVCTIGYLHHTPVNLFERDLVVAVNAREAVSPAGRDQFALAHRARLFGILPCRERVAPYEWDQLRAVFGFEELLIPRPGYRERVVRVVRWPVADGPTLPADPDEIKLQREGVWHNGPRNDSIATLAQLVRERNLAALQAYCPQVAAAVAAVAAPRVVVLVATVEHGLALANRLPGWPLLTDRAGVLTTSGLTAEEVQVLQAGQAAWASPPPQAIMTTTGLQGLDLTNVDVIVRADAGVDLPAHIEGKLVEPADTPARPLLLLDPDDRHPLLQRRSRQRRRAYEERGWFAPGVDAAQRRAELFLAARAR